MHVNYCDLISGYIRTVWRQPQDHDHWLIVTLKVFWHTSMKKGDNCVCLLNTPWFYKVDILAISDYHFGIFKLLTYVVF
jgi:hypothetical protein